MFSRRATGRTRSLPMRGFLSSDLASRTRSGKPLASSSRKSIKPLLVFSKLFPSASRSEDLIFTPGSRRILAGRGPSEKKRQPAASSNLLILIRAVASLSDIPYANLVAPRFVDLKDVQKGISALCYGKSVADVYKKPSLSAFFSFNQHKTVYVPLLSSVPYYGNRKPLLPRCGEDIYTACLH